MKERKQSFIHGAAVLAVSGVAVKLIGALFKIPLGTILGPVGMASFSVAYNIYALLFVLSTAGVPIAVSKLVSESVARSRYYEAGKIYRVSRLVFVLFGLSGFALLYFFAPQISGIMGNREAYLAVRAISPAVLFVSFSAINRGYFQGLSDMYPTATSEVLEALGKLIFGLLPALYLKRCGCSDFEVAAGAVLGVSSGALLSALFFALRKGKFDKTSRGESRKAKEILFSLLRMSVPITLGASVISLTNVIDSAIVMNLMQKATMISEERAKWLFGAYNFSSTVFNLPSALVMTLSVSLVPTVSAAFAKGEMKKLSYTVNTGVKFTMLLSMASMCGILALSEGIIDLIYGSGIGRECVSVSGQLLAIMSPAIAPLSLVSITNAIHQALGYAQVPVKSCIAGCVVKIVSNLILVAIPEINIYGAAVSTVLCYMTIAVLNLRAVLKYGFVRLKLSDAFMKPVLLGIVTYSAAILSKKVLCAALSEKISTLASVGAGGVACIVCAFLLGVVSLKEIKGLFCRKKYSIF